MTTTNRLSLASALRQARSEVSVNKLGDQYTVDTWSDRYQALVTGQPTWYANARRIAKETIAERALSLLTEDNDSGRIQRWVEEHSWEIQSADAMVRRGAQALGLIVR